MRIVAGSPLAKAAAVVAIALLLLVPLAMLHHLVSERASLREEAVRRIAQGWGGRQTLGGPMLAIPVSRGTDARAERTTDWLVLPGSLEIEADVDVLEERRRLGIYEVPVYVARVRGRARFDVRADLERLAATDPSVRAHLERARLLLPVSDPRGLRSVASSGEELAAAALEPARAFPLPVLSAPVRADAGLGRGEHVIEFSVETAGTESIAFLPLAGTTTVRIGGNWPHPGFARGPLPTDRRIADGRFDATWRVLDINRPIPRQWSPGEVAPAELLGTALGVQLVQPVDLYQRTERAVKYAGLFIGLTLLTLLLWDHLAGRPLHPVHYGLTGLALSIFYLLLLALAEHVGFAPAYALAAAALCILLGVYLAGALRSRRSGYTAGALFSAVYALLYLLVASEDYALLAGALALFALLAAVMVLTRKVDWYGAGAAEADA